MFTIQEWIEKSNESPHISNTFSSRSTFTVGTIAPFYPRIISYIVTTHRVYSQCSRDDVADNCEHEPRHGGS